MLDVTICTTYSRPPFGVIARHHNRVVVCCLPCVVDAMQDEYGDDVGVQVEFLGAETTERGFDQTCAGCGDYEASCDECGAALPECDCPICDVVTIQPIPTLVEVRCA